MNGKEGILREFYPPLAGGVRDGVSEALNVLAHTVKRIATGEQRDGEKQQNKQFEEAVHGSGP